MSPPTQARPVGAGAHLRRKGFLPAQGGDCATDGDKSDPGRETGAILARIADLHHELSDSYRILAEELPKELDVLANLSPVGGVETTTETRAPAPEFLRVQDVAKRLQVDSKTVRRWRANGEMPPAFANGSIVRWRAEVIDEWIASQEGSP